MLCAYFTLYRMLIKNVRILWHVMHWTFCCIPYFQQVHVLHPMSLNALFPGLRRWFYMRSELCVWVTLVWLTNDTGLNMCLEHSKFLWCIGSMRKYHSPAYPPYLVVKVRLAVSFLVLCLFLVNKWLETPKEPKETALFEIESSFSDSGHYGNALLVWRCQLQKMAWT